MEEEDLILAATETGMRITKDATHDTITSSD